MTIKDHIWMRGALATNGSLAYRDFVPDVDCEAVARLRAASSRRHDISGARAGLCRRGHRERDISTLRVAYTADMGLAPVNSDVRRAFARAIGTLSNLGCHLTEAQPSTDNPITMWNLCACCEGDASEGPLLAEWEAQMSPGTADIIRAGRDLAGWEYVDGLHVRGACTRTWSEFFMNYDLLVSPCMQLMAFDFDILSPSSIDGQTIDPFFDDWCSLVLPANLTGQPAISIPMGFGDGGLPVGMQVMGRRFVDATVLTLAAAYERASPWHHLRPGLGSSPPAAPADSMPL